MKITVLDNRDVIIDINDNFGTENENNATTLNLSVPDIYSNANKKIVFLTDDGNFWDLIQNNSYKITNAITKYKNISAYIWITDSEKEIDFRSRTFDITFNSNQEPDDVTPSPEEISIWDTMITQLNNGLDTLNRETLQLEDALEEVDNIDIDGSKTGNVATITITRKDGTEKEVQILDGTDYVITEEDYDEIADIVEEDITPLIPTKVSDLDNDSGFIDANVNNLTNYTLKTNTGSSIELSINSSTYVMTLNLKNSNGNVISTGNVDLPLETMVVGARYDATNRMIILTLQNGTEVSFSVADLVSGLQTEITSSNKLSSDLVDDTNNLNKFVTEQEKTTWNNKSDFSGSYNDLSNKPDLSLKEDNSNKVSSLSQSSTNIQYPGAKLVYDELQIKERQIQALESIANDLYNAFPKTPYGEGTSITLENTKVGKLDYENNIVGHGDTSQDSTIGKNLLNYNNLTTSAINVGFQVDSNGNISDSTPTGDNRGFNYASATWQMSLSAGTYTISFDFSTQITSSSSACIIFDENGNQLKNISNNDLKNVSSVSKNFTLTETTNIGIMFKIYDGVCKIQIESGSSPSAWEKYTGGIASPNPSFPENINIVTGTQEIVVKNGNNEVVTTKTIHLGSLELVKKGDYQDYIFYDENEGTWYKKNNVAKKIFNGTENWAVSSSWAKTNTNVFYLPTSETPDSIKNPWTDIAEVYCSHFIPTSRNIMNSNDENGITFTGTQEVGSGAITIRIDNTIGTDETTFKTWLGTHNVTLYYCLATGIITEITDTTLIEELYELLYMKSLDNETIIEASGNLPMILKVRALKGE